jgi:hypothetical protein
MRETPVFLTFRANPFRGMTLAWGQTNRRGPPVLNREWGAGYDESGDNLRVNSPDGPDEKKNVYRNDTFISKETLLKRV